MVVTLDLGERRNSHRDLSTGYPQPTSGRAGIRLASLGIYIAACPFGRVAFSLQI